MAKKYYAVRKGKTTGIFETWDACKAQVTGFSGAEYKSFPTIEEATAYLQANEKREKVFSDAVAETEEGAVAYVDGSFRVDTGEFSCGAVLFYKGETKYFSQKFQDEEMAAMRNVAGEIMGSVSVIRYCIEQKIPALSIYHDYEGVAKWALGEWKTNKEGTKAYQQFCKEAQQKIALRFVKVKGHSGDTYNDMADALAKKALGI